MVQKSSDRDEPAKRGRGRPRGFDPAETLRRIQRVFWTGGYASTSLDDIAVATGLNRPSLYAAFGDKRALYLAALNRSRTESVSMLEQALAPDEPLRAALERVYSGSAALYMRGEGAQRGCFLVGTAVTEAVLDEAVRDVLGESLEELSRAFTRRFARAVEDGDLPRATDVESLATHATAALNGMAVRARAGADAPTLERIGRSFIDLVCGPRQR